MGSNRGRRRQSSKSGGNKHASVEAAERESCNLAAVSEAGLNSMEAASYTRKRPLLDSRRNRCCIPLVDPMLVD